MKKAISLLLTASILLGLLMISASASSKPLYVNFGDSIAWGRIENEDNFPDYKWEKDSFSGLFASYLGTVRTSYARRGVQTTDILYMIDEDFRNGVDSGKITVDSWHTHEYPPYDGVSLAEICENTANADYITLVVGICDFVSYPDELKSQRLDKIEDVSEEEEYLDECLRTLKLDSSTYAALRKVLTAREEKSSVTAQYIADILTGFSEYQRYYPRIVSDFRKMNPDAKIILFGNYLPGIAALTEGDGSAEILRAVNKLLDKINYVVKNTAIMYNCYYVETMGVESVWHPTVKGHQQIFERIVSVLEGNRTYAGGIQNVTYTVSKITESVNTVKKTYREIISSALSSIRLPKR